MNRLMTLRRCRICIAIGLLCSLCHCVKKHMIMVRDHGIPLIHMYPVSSLRRLGVVSPATTLVLPWIRTFGCLRHVQACIQQADLAIGNRQPMTAFGCKNNQRQTGIEICLTVSGTVKQEAFYKCAHPRGYKTSERAAFLCTPQQHQQHAACDAAFDAHSLVDAIPDLEQGIGRVSHLSSSSVARRNRRSPAVYIVWLPKHVLHQLDDRLHNWTNHSQRPIESITVSAELDPSKSKPRLDQLRSEPDWTNHSQRPIELVSVSVSAQLELSRPSTS